MPIGTQSIEFLNQLEIAELQLLNWGLVDGFFDEREIETKAEEFLNTLRSRGETPDCSDGWQLLETLLDVRLLWRVPGTRRYRTRMAEAVRLFARLRQIFPDQNWQAWRSSPNLVADYRLQVRPRLYPLRELDSQALVERLRSAVPLSALQEGVVRGLVGSTTGQSRLLRQFQCRAAERILRATREGRASGTIVSAGTGSGKTLAFYLPCFAVLASHISKDFWTKCIALYPRSELLKDQMREALENTKRLAPGLAASHKRKMIVAALYGDVPYNPQAVATNEAWPALSVRGLRAHECPLVRCPSCNGKLAWLVKDIESETERLVCTECSTTIESDEIRLTRVRLLREPPDVLFTSTEMLNQRLSASRFSPLFGIGLREDRRPLFVLIDEVHAYEGTHGAHVAFLLRRWRRAADATCHFVGLSATLADAPRFFADLIGLGPGDVSEIAPDPEELAPEGAEYLLALRGDPASGTSLLSTSIQSLMLLRRILERDSRTDLGNRVFGFTDNLDVINRLYLNLLDAEGWTAARRPNPRRPMGSLANLRSTTLPAAAERLAVGQNWALVEDIGHALSFGSRTRIGRTSSQDAGVNADAEIVVATSSLEVGFDDPEVGAVLQHKAPLSAASFLQRKGRAGRRTTMRPWTVVTLSDYGRDRAAYQAYDYLFSPSLEVRQLPVSNRAIQRMQAVLVLFEWLAARLPRNSFVDPWSDFSQPSTNVSSPSARDALKDRQGRYIAELHAVLEITSVREELGRFISRSLAISDTDVAAALWEAPRSLMTEVIPTLLRRLERDWVRADGSGTEYYISRVPLPEFVPRALFSDLQLPELSIRVPQRQAGEFAVELMPVAQGIREFAPGRVSRRFGVTHGRQRFWIPPGPGSEVSIDGFCPSTARQDLGLFRMTSDVEIRVFRPYVIDTELTPVDIQQSSNSFLNWRTQLVRTAEGECLDLPSASHWASVIESIRVHSHQMGLPLEVRRFAIGATAHIGRGRGQTETLHLTFSALAPNGQIPAAIGFVSDVDAVEIQFRYPVDLRDMVQREPALLRALRVGRFRHTVRTSPALESTSNIFQREWLSHVYLSSITAEAVLNNVTLEEGESRVFTRQSGATLEDVLHTIFQWGAELAEEEDDSPDSEEDAQPAPDDADAPRRYQELVTLFANQDVVAALHRASTALWEPPDTEWDSWLREQYKATFGVAFFEAIHQICPRTTADALNLELSAVTSSDSAQVSGHPELDRFWITETTLGGSGFIEEFLARYSEDPRRFFHFLDATLCPSDLEVTAEDLGRVVQSLASQDSNRQALRTAVTETREAKSHEQSKSALRRLRIELSEAGVLPTQTLMISLSARLLRPGFTSVADSVLARLLQLWTSEERRLGIDIDARVIAFVKSFDQEIDTLVDAGDGGRPWRYGVLLGMLWARPSQIRAESLKVPNLFEPSVQCDRLIVRAATSEIMPRVSVENADWFAVLAEGLVRNGTAEISCPISRPEEMAGALRRITVVPVDSDAVLTYARLTAVQREEGLLIARLELPEAWQ